MSIKALQAAAKSRPRLSARPVSPHGRAEGAINDSEQ